MPEFTKDKTLFWKTYFPDRNGVSPDYPEFQVGRNFTNETFYYMSKHRVSRDIANKIESFTSNNPYFLIEVCAGIGGNTLEFLDRKNCATVMSFEQNNERAIMLQRNIMGYNFGDKSIVINTAVTGDEVEQFSSYQDAIFYFDPPWLPENIPAEATKSGKYKDYYIRENMKVGKFTLEEWLTELKNIAYMVVFRVPDNYKLKEVEGWTFETENLGKTPQLKALGEDGMLYCCFNNRSIKNGDMEKFGGYIKNLNTFRPKLQSINPALGKHWMNVRERCYKKSNDEAKKDSFCIFVKYTFVDPDPLESEKPKIEEPLKPLPSTKREVTLNPAPGYSYDGRRLIPAENQVWLFKDIPRPDKDLDVNSPEWVAQFQNYLKVVLSKFVKNKDGSAAEDKINKLINDTDSMNIWIQAFTDESYNRDPNQNYEILEIIGDAAQNYSFKMFIYKYFQTLELRVTEKLVSSFVQFYMSKGWQKHLNKTFHFTDWILKDKSKDVGPKMEENLSESFCGALHEIADRNIANGAGVILVRKYIDFIGKKIVLEPERSLPFKTRVIQYMPAFGLKDSDARAVASGYAGKIKVDVILSELAINRLRSTESGRFSSIPKNGVIGTGVGPNKDEAETNAYYQAFKFFNDIGIDEKYVDQLKEERSWKRIRDIDLALYNKFTTRLRRNHNLGLDDIYFDETTEEIKNGNVLVQIVTELNGKPTILATATGKDKLEGQIEAMKAYIRNND
jgi:dsRNA-specific ribonuclease